MYTHQNKNTDSYTKSYATQVHPSIAKNSMSVSWEPGGLNRAKNYSTVYGGGGGGGGSWFSFLVPLPPAQRHQQRYGEYPPSAYFSNKYLSGDVAIIVGERIIMPH
jgi:hypothetical protein